MHTSVIINKKWYLSKTVWVNAVALVAIMLQTALDKVILTPEVQVAILSAINIGLRTLTKENIVW